MYNGHGATLPFTGMGLAVGGWFGWLSLAVLLITVGYMLLAARKLVPAKVTRNLRERE